jgi:hypothetical protein
MMTLALCVVTACRSGGGGSGTDLSRIQNAAESVALEPGSGSFVMAGAAGRRAKSIDVYYHVPAGFTADSPVLLVAPGAGRDAWDYRDVWVEASETHGVVVLSPHYSEAEYPEFWSYNLAGMLRNVEINDARTAMVGYEISTEPSEWIFGDLDRIFASVRSALGLRAQHYDLFGHSAGGQLLHRYVIFGRSALVGRVYAANSGWYTVPTFDDEFPYGLGGSAATEESLRDAFSKDLVVLLGEMDDRNETRGDLARTPEIDVQGLSRIERGRYFFEVAEATAERLETEFNWSMVVVPGVGHDRVGMSRAAAEQLYGGQ